MQDIENPNKLSGNKKKTKFASCRLTTDLKQTEGEQEELTQDWKEHRDVVMGHECCGGQKTTRVTPEGRNQIPFKNYKDAKKQIIIFKIFITQTCASVYYL